MDEALLKRARECKFTRSAIRELAEQIPPDDEEINQLLARAVSARDELAFTHLLLAALEAGRKVEAGHLVEGTNLLPNPAIVGAAAMHVSGQAGQALIEAVDRGGLPREWETAALLMAGAWFQEHSPGQIPPTLIARARIAARQAFDRPLAQLQLLGLADLLQDEGLRGILETVGCPKSDETSRKVMQLILDQAKGPVLQDVPEESKHRVLSGYTVRRAAPRIGRNDPCPCGSGKKYKQCCLGKDEQRLLQSSSVPGMTLEELRENPERHLTKERLMEMQSYELARLDPAKVGPALLPILVNELLVCAEYEAAVSLFEKLATPPILAGHWRDALRRVSDAARLDLAQRLLKVRPESAPILQDLELSTRLLLESQNPNPALDMIEAEAMKALRSDRPAELVDLAYSLLASRYPALGILVTRSVVPLAEFFDAITLFDVLLETRDKLNLFTPEPFDAIIEQRFHDETSGKTGDSKALSEAHRHLDEKNQEVRKLKTDLEALHRELEKREQQPPPPPAPAPAVAPPSPGDDRALSDLRRRVDSLREELKQRHNERNQLRRELQAAMVDNEALRQKASQSAAPAPAESPPEEDQLLMPEESLGPQPVRLPEFPRKFAETISSLPKQVGHAAMALIGRLAGGEASAFIGIKRLHANHHIMRQRVGADYRLLFSLKPGVLEVIALVNRRDLERKIKSLT